MTEVVATNQTILVVGGGISGVTAALEAAECGKDVVLVEKSPALGGRTALLYRYFPKLCHPTCGLEINLRRIKSSPGLRVLTLAEVTAISGTRGDYTATIRISPRYVNENCTACGACADAVETTVDNPLFSLTVTTVLPMSSPASNSSACPIRTAPPEGKSCARPTAGKRRMSPSFSAPVRATRITCGTARASAAWPR